MVVVPLSRFLSFLIENYLLLLLFFIGTTFNKPSGSELLAPDHPSPSPLTTKEETEIVEG